MSDTASPQLQNNRQLLAYAALALGLQMVQATNGTFLAPLLESLGTNPFWISVILSLDPITCILILPWVNRWSDRTASPWGRRLPFIAIGTVLACASLAAIGSADRPVAIAIAMVILFIGTSAVWGPYRAALPEIVTSDRHTVATGLQGLLQGIGILISLGGGGLLLTYGHGRPFWMTAACLLLCSAVTITVMRRGMASGQAKTVPAISFADFFRQTPDLHWLLAAQTCWWGAISGISTFAVLYVTHEILGITHLDGPAGQAGTQQAVGVLLLFAVAGMLTAVPCGRLAARYGKVRVLRWGLLLMLAGMTVALFATDLTTLRVGIVCCGAGYAAVQVLPVTLFAELHPPGHEGSVMSLLGVFTDGPLMIGYLLEGWLIARTGNYRVPFMLGPIFIVAAWWCIGRLQKAGRTIPSPT